MTMRLNPYFVMKGNAREAIAFYEKALGATVVRVETFGDMPADPHHPLPDGLKNQIMHAQLKVGQAELMFSDTIPGTPHQIGNNVNIAIATSDADDSSRVFTALADGGRITMPLQATFWSPAYGQVTDKFGVAWQITTEPKA